MVGVWSWLGTVGGGGGGGGVGDCGSNQKLMEASCSPALVGLPLLIRGDTR